MSAQTKDKEKQININITSSLKSRMKVKIALLSQKTGQDITQNDWICSLIEKAVSEK